MIDISDAQLAAARVLIDLLERGLPPVFGWQITDDGRVRAQVMLGTGNAADARAALAPFADLLDAPIQVGKPYGHDARHTPIRVTGTYRDVRVEAWTAVATAQVTAELNGANS